MDKNTSSALKIWVISDGKAGHMAGSRGLVEAFGKIQATRVIWVHADLRIPGSHRLLTSALRLFPNKWNAFWINFFYKIDEQPSDTPDIICSAGRETQFLNILWARKYSARNFFVGTLRNLQHDLFAAFITPFSINAPNHIKVDVPLTDIDRDALQTATEIDMPKGAHPVWALLIGGKTPGYGFERQDWLNLAKAMQTLSEKHGGKWLLTTSRRTGTDIENILKSAVPSQYILDAVWHSDDKRKVVKPFLNAAEAVFCTEDSMACWVKRCRQESRFTVCDRVKSISTGRRPRLFRIWRREKKYTVSPWPNWQTIRPLCQRWKISIYLTHHRSTG